jgi:hypothetical protein
MTRPSSATPPTPSAPILFSGWLTLCFSLMFSGLLVFPSRTGLMNALDAVFFVPALIYVAVACRHQPLALIKRHGWLLAFLFYATLSTFFGPAPNPSRFVRALIEIFTLFAFVELAVQRYPHAFWRALLIGTGVAAVAALVDFFAYYFIVDRPFSSQLYGVFEVFKIRPWLVLDTNQLYASMYCITLPFFAFFASRQLPPGRLTRAAPYLISLALLVYLAANQRRSTLVALAVGCLALPIINLKRRLLVPLVAVAVVAAGVLVFSPELITKPVTGHGMANETRELHIVVEGQPVVQDHPHNYYLSLLYHIGFLGLGLWVMLWAPALWRGWRAYPQRSCVLAAAMATGFTAVLFDGIHPYTPFMYNWPSVWIPMALLVAYVRQQETRDESRSGMQVPQ